MFELDGIRGWAALNVVLFHIFVETFRVVLPQLRNFWTSLLLNGHLDVSIFFVLSGEALSAAYFSGAGEAAVVKLGLKRYFRLTIPVLATCLIIFALFAVHLVPDGYTIVHRDDWLQISEIRSVSIVGYLRFAFYAVYWGGWRSVDPFLWTMSYEMLGSLMVFFVLLMFRRIRYIWALLLLALPLFFIRTEYSDLACFIVGLLFSAARQNGIFRSIQSRKWSAPLSWLVLAAMACLAARAEVWDLPMALFAIPLVLAIFCNRALCGFFASGPMRMLGRISFPLYLVQYPVLISLTSWMIVFAASHGGIGMPSAMIIGMLSLAACLAAAFLFLPVEHLTKWTGNKVVSLLYRP